MKSSRVLHILLSVMFAVGSAFAAETTTDDTKAAKLILPKLQFQQATVDEGLAFLGEKSRALDPAKTGVTIILVASDKSKGAKVDLDLVNVSLADAVKYFALAAGLEMTREGEAFVLKSK